MSGTQSPISAAKVSLLQTLIKAIIAMLGLVLLIGCSEPPLTQLEQVQKQGYIKVYTRIAPTTMYVGEDGFTGFEYELVKLFADDLGVRVQIVTENDIAYMLGEIQQGHADFAAAGLSVTAKREQTLRFGPPYQQISSKLVYKQGNRRPRDFNQVDKKLAVMANSSHSEELRKIQLDYPKLSWVERSDVTSQDLLDEVLAENIDYTIADSNELDLARQVNFELAVAFNISQPESLAWVFKKQKDHSLYAKAIEFFSKVRADGTLDYLIERYYGHLSKFDYVGSREFLRAIDSKLPTFKSDFYEAAGNDLDWRFLAAMGYQESHWEPDAKSPTGVRGLMMLTLDTAKDLGIADRTDPKQSIFGGAEYFREVKKKVPDRITEPDRTWFALAGYNVGFGHLEDARRLTEQAGEDPDKWLSVKKYLPLLRQKKWYSQTRYGYARGDEPVRYVNNIRRYYQVLLQVEEPKPGVEELLDEHVEDTVEEAKIISAGLDEENNLELDTEETDEQKSTDEQDQTSDQQQN
ncbi:MAG: membrane-bound lytic murein transglycosylase MltF [Kangiellaceae bacterium]|nr:membrane-bound lytic murein transglycosylase MltF [Kangiellaceae bacterium]